MKHVFFILILLIISMSHLNTGYGETIGEIRPILSANTSNTYVWNGRVLRLNFGSSWKNSWNFDGKTLKPACGGSATNVYVWNGSRLRPLFGATATRTWTWNGTELRQQISSKRRRGIHGNSMAIIAHSNLILNQELNGLYQDTCLFQYAAS